MPHTPRNSQKAPSEYKPGQRWPWLTSFCADSLPTCEANSTPVTSGTNNNVTCHLNYTRFSDVSPIVTLTSSITWPDGQSGYFRWLPADSHRRGTVSATLTDVAVTSEGIPAINWTAVFNFSISVQPSSKYLADNNDTWIWTSNIIPVWSELQLTVVHSWINLILTTVVEKSSRPNYWLCFASICPVYNKHITRN